MRVLAIDTALAACTATVLDTDHGVVASETLPAIVQASPPRGDIDLRDLALYIKADASNSV